MKSFVYLFLFLVVPFSGFAQIGGEDEVYLTGDRIDATFQGGGMDNFSEFINKEFDYSKVSKAGKMVGAFTIDENGNVKNIKIIHFFDIESATEFIRVLKKCPKWEPAKRGGKPISIDIKYPMVFRMKKKEN
ncbi:MAG: energy transducer TonB [Bacteroidota bacterium]